MPCTLRQTAATPSTLATTISPISLTMSPPSSQNSDSLRVVRVQATQQLSKTTCVSPGAPCMRPQLSLTSLQNCIELQPSRHPPHHVQWPQAPSLSQSSLESPQRHPLCCMFSPRAHIYLLLKHSPAHHHALPRDPRPVPQFNKVISRRARKSWLPPGTHLQSPQHTSLIGSQDTVNLTKPYHSASCLSGHLSPSQHPEIGSQSYSVATGTCMGQFSGFGRKRGNVELAFQPQGVACQRR
jgi:hypothetical protein